MKVHFLLSLPQSGQASSCLNVHLLACAVAQEDCTVAVDLCVWYQSRTQYCLTKKVCTRAAAFNVQRAKRKRQITCAYIVSKVTVQSSAHTPNLNIRHQLRIWRLQNFPRNITMSSAHPFTLSTDRTIYRESLKHHSSLCLFDQTARLSYLEWRSIHKGGSKTVLNLLMCQILETSTTQRTNELFVSMSGKGPPTQDRRVESPFCIHLT